ncbi:MAG: DUF2807 domain-containing protein [Phycisphaerae bacterium]|jgi:hypothetical protein
MQKLAASIALLLLTTVGGCGEIAAGLDPGVPGSGVAKSESRAIGAFGKIELEGTAAITVTIGEPGPLAITADDNLLPLITTAVQNGCLVIKPERKLSPKTTVRIQVTTRAIERFHCAGAGEVLLEGVAAPRLDLDAAGAWSLAATGQSDVLHVTLAGTCRAALDRLAARTGTVSAAGASSARVNVAETLDVNIAGVGSVEYLGDPQLTKTIAGAGSVRKKGE